jgi:hypothetical protein
LEKARPVLDAFVLLCQTDNVQTMADILWGLSYISDGENERIQAVIESGVLPLVFQCFTIPNVDIITPALRVIGNIVSGDDTQTQIMIDSGCIIPLGHAVMCDQPHLRKEGCWALSNLTAGTPDQIQGVLQSGLIDHLCVLLEDDEPPIMFEATWVITNAISGGTAEQAAFLLESGAVQALMHALLVQPIPENMISIVFEVYLKLLDMFKETEFIDPVRELIIHNITPIYQELTTRDYEDENAKAKVQDVLAFLDVPEESWAEFLQAFEFDDDDDDDGTEGANGADQAGGAAAGSMHLDM